MMKTFNALIAIMVLFLAILTASAEEVVDKQTFNGISELQIKAVSGDCRINAVDGNGVTVEVRYDVDPKDSFRPEMYKDGNELKINENWSGSSSGKVQWLIEVPKNIEVEYKTASGDLSVEGLHGEIEAETASGEIELTDVNGEFEISTASGDISIRDAKGDFEFSCASGEIQALRLEGEIECKTASGDIEVQDSRGDFDIKCASGEIEAMDIIIDEESSFKAASGDVQVKLKESTTKDLELGSASGDVLLNLNGQEMKGTIQAEFRQGRGNVDIPFNSVKQEEFSRSNQDYTRIYYGDVAGKPVITLRTASGRITVEK
jgi:DUF4097 and DUF4098 domain-containing protein YvlB